jgi:hypothetical protein
MCKAKARYNPEKLLRKGNLYVKVIKAKIRVFEGTKMNV